MLNVGGVKKGKMPYLTENTRLTKIGEHVEVYANPHDHVALVINDKGEKHSCRVEILSDTPVSVDEPDLKQRKKPESKKPLTQAEKIQIEYLNSLK